MTTSDSLAKSQLAYYRARATEYDTTFVPYMDAALLAELTRLRAGNLRGEVLELACGTGFWTRHLAGLADRITALDGSVEMLAEARRRGLSNVDFRQQDLFHWQPRRHWDAVFFAHWLAHAPEDRFDPFWAAVRRAVSRTLRTGAAILANPVHGSSGVDPAGSGPRGGTRQAAWAGASVEPGAGLGDLQTDCAPTVGH